MQTKRTENIFRKTIWKFDKMSCRELIDRANLEVVFRPRIGQPGVADRTRQLHLVLTVPHSFAL
jgi:hypothetical protein